MHSGHKPQLPRLVRAREARGHPLQALRYVYYITFLEQQHSVADKKHAPARVSVLETRRKSKISYELISILTGQPPHYMFADEKCCNTECANEECTSGRAALPVSRRPQQKVVRRPPAARTAETDIADDSYGDDYPGGGSTDDDNGA